MWKVIVLSTGKVLARASTEKRAYAKERILRQENHRNSKMGFPLTFISNKTLKQLLYTAKRTK